MSKKDYRTNNKKEKFPEILKECMGLVTKACEKADISRTTYYEWRKEDPAFAIACDYVQEHVGDFVESKLYKLVNDENATAVIFYCKTKLKNRGYVERIETTGKDGDAIEMNVNFKSNNTDERILAEFKAEAIIEAQNRITKGGTDE